MAGARACLHDPRGAAWLRFAIAERHNLDATHMFSCAGAQEVLTSVIQFFRIRRSRRWSFRSISSEIRRDIDMCSDRSL